jgi:hypothetical protein
MIVRSADQRVQFNGLLTELTQIIHSENTGNHPNDR